jgi:hypothetical protein
MDSQADQPPGGGAWPSEGTPRPGTPQPGSDQPRPGTPQPGGDQPWAGTPQPDGDQPWAGPPQPGSGRHRVRPGRVWYLAAVVLVLAGVAWLVFGFVSLRGKVDAFSRVPLPAGGTVSLTHSGGYVVYYEGAGAASGHIPRFNVRIAPVAPPATVGGLQSYAGAVSYTIGVHQGRAVLTLQVLHPGRFLVAPSGASALAGTGSDLAFGTSIAGSIVGIVLPSIGLIFLGIAGAVVLFIIRLTRTRRVRAQGNQPPAHS